MSISVMAMGRMKEKPYRQMADEYLKRLSRYGKFEGIELPDLPEPANTREQHCIRYRRFAGAGGCRYPPRKRRNVDEQNDVPASAGARDAAGTAVSCHENPRRREVS